VNIIVKPGLNGTIITKKVPATRYLPMNVKAEKEANKMRK
jgi:hypothetical protein